MPEPLRMFRSLADGFRAALYATPTGTPAVARVLVSLVGKLQVPSVGIIACGVCSEGSGVPPTRDDWEASVRTPKVAPRFSPNLADDAADASQRLAFGH